jgi:hypothetical protein
LDRALRPTLPPSNGHAARRLKVGFGSRAASENSAPPSPIRPPSAPMISPPTETHDFQRTLINIALY